MLRHKNRKKILSSSATYSIAKLIKKAREVFNSDNSEFTEKLVSKPKEPKEPPEPPLKNASKPNPSLNLNLTKRYVKMAFELKKKNRIRLPDELRNSFCKKCYALWIPARTITTWFDSKHDCIRLKCECGFTKRV